MLEVLFRVSIWLTKQISLLLKRDKYIAKNSAWGPNRVTLILHRNINKNIVKSADSPFLFLEDQQIEVLCNAINRPKLFS